MLESEMVKISLCNNLSNSYYFLIFHSSHPKYFALDVSHIFFQTMVSE